MSDYLSLPLGWCTLVHDRCSQSGCHHTVGAPGCDLPAEKGQQEVLGCTVLVVLDNAVAVIRQGQHRSPSECHPHPLPSCHHGNCSWQREASGHHQLEFGWGGDDRETMVAFRFGILKWDLVTIVHEEDSTVQLPPAPPRPAGPPRTGQECKMRPTYPKSSHYRE